MEGNVADSGAHLITVLVAEYQALKAEQTARIVLRDNAISANLVAIGAILAVAAALEDQRNLILLMIPFAAASTYWVYLNNDLRVSTLQRYLQEEFPRLVARTLDGSLGDEEVRSRIGQWEVYHRANTRARCLRRVSNLLFVLLGSAGASVGALAVTAGDIWRSGSFWPLLIWMAAASVAITLLVALVWTSDIGRRSDGKSSL